MKTITDRIRITAPARQEKLAEEMGKALAGYRIPEAVKRRTGIRSLSDIREDWLIVVCTPETPEDPEILSEIDRFLREGKRDQILTLLAEGTPDASFPGNLLREENPDGTVTEHEPLAANIVAGSAGEQKKKLRVEKLRILAPMLHASFDDLMNRSRRKRNRILLAAGTAAVTAAAVFFGLAVSRMQRTAAQEAELQAQNEQTNQARTEAESRAHEARLKLGETVAMQAKTALERNDTELALLLCLEFEEEIPESEILAGTFRDALERLCAAGYVPVTSEKSYKRTRGMDRTLVDAGGYVVKPEPDKGPAPESPCYIPMPESRPGDRDWNNTDGTVRVNLCSYSVEQDCAVYTGSLKYGELNERETAIWIRSISDQERTFWLRRPDGTLFTVREFECLEILDDGKVLICGDNRLFRFVPSGPVQIPAVDDSDEMIRAMPFSIRKIWKDTVIRDKVFMFSERAIAVFGKDPFRLLYTIDDEVTENPITSDNSKKIWVGAAVGILPDGGGRLIISNGHVYDTADGKHLFKIGPGQSRIFGASEYKTHEISSEGWLPAYYGGDYHIVDLKDGSDAGVLKTPGGSRYCLYGPEDKETGQRSAAVILTFISFAEESELWPRIFWEYHENATDVPDTPEEQTALAKELLKGRKLVPSERSRYHLD